MNYLTVDLYQDFKCIANSCPNTCCAGWSITIDETTYKKMVEHEYELGTSAEDWLEKEDGRIVAKLKNQRCCMLNNNNLCNVVLKLGPEYLSDTCKLYPRRIYQYGSVVEAHLAMSCPVVIAKLMEKESVQFNLIEDEIPTLSYPFSKLYIFESAIRSSIIDILQNNADISLNTRLYIAFNILDKAIQSYQNEQLDFNLLKPTIDLYSQKDTLCSFDIQLHDIVNESNRYIFLQELQTILFENLPEGHFEKLAIQTYVYFTKNDLEKYLSDIIAFRANIKEYTTFYTNYWIYRIFSDILEIPDFNLSKEKMLYIAMEFCCAQAVALASFVNKKKIDRDEYIYIISNISRMMEHHAAFRQYLIEKLNKNNMINAAGFMLMILI